MTTKVIIAEAAVVGAVVVARGMAAPQPVPAPAGTTEATPAPSGIAKLQNGQRVTAQEAMDQEFAQKGIPVELRPRLVGEGPALAF